MLFGERLRDLRKAKNLSQGELARRTGLFHSYISRVENGRTTPSLQTLEKMAAALEMPLYQMFYEDEQQRQLPNQNGALPALTKEAILLNKFLALAPRISRADRKLLLLVVQKMATRGRRRGSRPK